MTVQLLDRWDDLDGAVWDALAARSRTGSLFQSWAWHRAWWDAFGEGRRLALAAVFDGAALRGVAPWQVDQDGCLGLVGDGQADYLDLLVEPADAATLQALQRSAADVPGWSRGRWHNVPADAVLIQGSEPGRRVLSPPIPCPRLDLAAGEETRRRVNKKSLRRHVNYWRKQPGYRVEHLHGGESVAAGLDDFFDQHVGRWADTPTPSLFLEPRQRRFYQALVRRLEPCGALRFTRLWADGRPIAHHFGFLWRGTFVWYKPAFAIDLARKSPGEALLKELFEHALEQQARIFDFTVGGEAFKFRFASEVRHNHHVHAYRSALPYWRHATTERLKQGVKSSGPGRRIYGLAKRIGGRG